MDTLTVRERSERMGKVRSKNTKPELAVEKIIKKLGVRTARHFTNLPGSPDFVVPELKKAIFVHGCFWHRHSCRNGKRLPKSKKNFWVNKLEGNRKRDSRNLRALNRLGWSYITIWECKLSKAAIVENRIIKFLGDK